MTPTTSLIVRADDGEELRVEARWELNHRPRWLDIRIGWYVIDNTATYRSNAVFAARTVAVRRITDPAAVGAATAAFPMPTAPPSGPIGRGHLFWAAELVAPWWRVHARTDFAVPCARGVSIMQTKDEP